MFNATENIVEQYKKKIYTAQYFKFISYHLTDIEKKTWYFI